MDSEKPMREKLVDALAYSDALDREQRADRILWISGYQLSGGVLVGRTDTLSLVSEAKACFIDGHFIGTTVLAVSAMEHLLTDALIDRGLAKYGVYFANALKLARDQSLFEDGLLTEIDRLRLIRNPHAHLREVTDPDSLNYRYWNENRHPVAVLEDDARAAIKAMCSLLSAAVNLPSASKP